MVSSVTLLGLRDCRHLHLIGCNIRAISGFLRNLVSLETATKRQPKECDTPESSSPIASTILTRGICTEGERSGRGRIGMGSPFVPSTKGEATGASGAAVGGWWPHRCRTAIAAGLRPPETTDDTDCHGSSSSEADDRTGAPGVRHRSMFWRIPRRASR